MLSFLGTGKESIPCELCRQVFCAACVVFTLHAGQRARLCRGCVAGEKSGEDAHEREQMQWSLLEHKRSAAAAEAALAAERAKTEAYAAQMRRERAATERQVREAEQEKQRAVQLAEQAAEAANEERDRVLEARRREKDAQAEVSRNATPRCSRSCTCASTARRAWTRAA